MLVQKVLKDALNIQDQPGDEVYESYFDETELALQEARIAVNQVLNGVLEIELEPRKQSIRKLQHEFVEQHNLDSESIGDEPNRRLRVIAKDKLKNVG